MGRAIGVLKSRKVRIGVNASFVAAALVITGLTVRHFLKHGWPLHNADPILVGAAAALFVLGWIDSAALTPMAAAAAAGAEKTGVQIGFAVLAGIGIVAAGAVVALPVLARTILRRFKIAGWVHEHCACPREASKAWLCVSVSWGLRGAAVFVLLHGLAVGASFPLALAFLCASAASAALPIAPAGAATQAGAGAAILVAGGVSATNAIAFGVAAQALVILAGAACVVAAAAWHAALRVKPRLRAA